jgi:hypothetical protein
VDWFERQGFRVKTEWGSHALFAGDKLVALVDRPINLSALAQDLCAAREWRVDR